MARLIAYGTAGIVDVRAPRRGAHPGETGAAERCDRCCPGHFGLPVHIAHRHSDCFPPGQDPRGCRCRTVPAVPSFAVFRLHLGQMAEEFPPLVRDLEMIFHIAPLRLHRAQSLTFLPLDELQTAEPVQFFFEV